MTRTSAKLGLRSARLDVRRLASALTSFEIPRRLRAFVRAREISLVVLAIAIGVVGGLVVGAMSALVDLLHRVLFALPAGERLSGQAVLKASVALTVPCV